jgi:hypothetical protein
MNQLSIADLVGVTGGQYGAPELLRPGLVLNEGDLISCTLRDPCLVFRAAPKTGDGSRIEAPLAPTTQLPRVGAP